MERRRTEGTRVWEVKKEDGEGEGSRKREENTEHGEKETARGGVIREGSRIEGGCVESRERQGGHQDLLPDGPLP